MNISVPDDLAVAVRQMKLPVSKICQDALRQAVSQSAQASQTVLVETIENQARWREMVAAEYPEDARNERAVGALSELAGYIRSLSADDPWLLRMHAIVDGEIANIGGGDRWREAMDKYGFHWQPAPADGWHMLVTALEEDRETALKDDGDS
ncbi:MAG TPA: type II toxin-antitoxin system CcdA family antitoxin [Streptosporangiaceae bacterium]|nr:type II toxin-antitoxin system CcdA family antitoxin [Streptosporangiaceae bacterium]